MVYRQLIIMLVFLVVIWRTCMNGFMLVLNAVKEQAQMSSLTRLLTDNCTLFSVQTPNKI